VSKFERFFRVAGSLDVDHNDQQRYMQFVNQKLSGLLIRGQATAKANARDVIEPFDLPIGAGLQENIHHFQSIDGEVGFRSELARSIMIPQLDAAVSTETEAELPEILGGLSVALALSFSEIDPNVKNPQTEQWERAFRIFDQLI
jgi:hypothetical protein